MALTTNHPVLKVPVGMFDPHVARAPSGTEAISHRPRFAPYTCSVVGTKHSPRGAGTFFKGLVNSRTYMGNTGAVSPIQESLDDLERE